MGHRVGTGHFKQQRLSWFPSPLITALGAAGNSHTHSNGDSLDPYNVLGRVPSVLTFHPPTPAEAGPAGATLQERKLRLRARPGSHSHRGRAAYDAGGARNWQPG